LARLRAEGCDEVQGYLFSRPLQAANFELFHHGQLLSLSPADKVLPG
jgi:EAL domain-containing protein (putative c-di-GMP-specific phosphodiesterase class I)